MIPDELKQVIKQPKTAQNAADKAQAVASQRAQEAITSVIKSRTQEEIAALPIEQRWREYGRTYEEEQEYRRTHDQNPDGTAKHTTENIIGNIIGGALLASGGLVIGGLIAGGAGVAAVSEAAAVSVPAAAAPVAAAIVPVVAPVAGGSILSTVIAGTGGAAQMGLYDSIMKVATNPTVGGIVGSLLGGGGSSQAATQAAAASANQQTTDVAKLALTLAQQAALGQANLQVKANGNTLDTGTASGAVPVWLWPVLGVAAFIAFIAAIVALFKRK